MNFFIMLFLVLALDFGLTFLLSQFIASSVLINMIISFVISFVYAFLTLSKEKRKVFYKTQDFYRLGGIILTVLLVCTCIIELI